MLQLKKRVGKNDFCGSALKKRDSYGIMGNRKEKLSQKEQGQDLRWFCPAEKTGGKTR